MPIIKSAKKALRSSKTKAQKNQKAKDKLKKMLKNANSDNLSEVIAQIDKSAKNNLINANKASRVKSQLCKKYSVKNTKTQKKPSLSKTKKSKK